MIRKLFRSGRNLSFERSYAAPIEIVWDAWTRAEMLQAWWGPEKTTVPECTIDLRIGGEIYVVMEAGEAMGKYQGTRWPMAGTITRLDEHERLTYDARSWTEGDEAGTTIHHRNDVTFSRDGEATTVQLDVAITTIGPTAMMAAFGMKWG